MTYERDDLDRQLVLLGHDDGGPSDSLRARALSASLAALEPPAFPRGTRSTLSDSSPPIARLVPDVPSDSADEARRRAHPVAEHPIRRRVTRRLLMMTRKISVRYGAVAAVMGVVLLGGFTIWPGGAGSEGSNGQWWLGPPTAWAGMLDAALGQALTKGVTCRERSLIVYPGGSSHESNTITTFHVSTDSYRRDIFDGGVLRETQWYTPDADDMVQTSVRFDTGSFNVLRHRGSFGRQNPIERLRFYVHLLDKADRQLGTDTIDGHDCVGFEIRASLYGDNPNTWIDRLWFDVDTKLPVRLEQSGRPVTGDSLRTLTMIRDDFSYGVMLLPDTFSPQIPAGFIDAHPDDLDGEG
ncbi:MAG: hypothetical protein GY842_01225 [bacterium]|nr:hypothetical protein [bacterium]